MLRLVAITALLVTGCGNDGPGSSSKIPSVAGTYTGPVTWTADGQIIATFDARITVVQADSQLTITGTLTYQGQAFPLPAVTGHVNATGFFTATGGGAASVFDSPECGIVRATASTLTFVGNTAQYVEQATSQYCGSWTFSGTLRR